ncbi:uncharacterized protein LOC131164912 [Malania oleifera]|uniref:uncharacterized protein LOC131164912 n=1 Tax=Malania oleifera TaxID=397392 RepID=UPI0025ADAAAB|nr:uncharacterized protein LOC131164912 [Malania oleifera]XP_057978439.1 uncharacterized protein LOC131164912 [Malania oleifera]
MAASVAMVSLRINAVSFDTQQRLPYNPHPKPKPKTPKTPLLSVVTSPSRTDLDITELLKHKNRDGSPVKSDELYLGYERWLPSPPKVEKPRSVFNAASLAYIGDSVYELYARRHFLFPPLNIEEYNDRVMAIVRCEAQDALLQKLIDDDYLSEDERKVLRWGRNISSSIKRSKKRAGVAVYNRASSLETLVGYLYLTNAERLEEVMLKLGFLAGGSAQLLLEEANSRQSG